MAHNVFRKGGIPALAHLSSDDASRSCPCSLVVRVDETHKQATIALRFGVPLDGFDADQQISLVYDADNLVPGETRLGPARGDPSQLDRITRRGGKNFRSLRIALRQPCTVICPSSGSLAPRDASDARFQRLAALARATRLSITFDYTWLHPDKSAQFLSLTDSSARTGFPRNAAAVSSRETDWTVFSPGEPAPPDAPPAYEHASSKRHRPAARASSMSPPRTPAAKRPQLEPTAAAAPPSPTEKATTTTATPSPRLPPSSPPAGPFDLQDAVETAVAKLLPEAVQAALPDVLTRMLAVPAPLSPPAPKPNPVSPLHKLILDRLTDHADELAKQVTIETLEHAADLRDVADAELEEQLDDQRLEFTALKEDGIMEMRRLCDANLQELDEHATKLIESVEQETEDAYTTVREKLDELVGEKKMTLVKEVLRLDSELRRRRSPPEEPIRRARSVPLGSGQ